MENSETVTESGVIKQFIHRVEVMLRQRLSSSRIADAECTSRKILLHSAPSERAAEQKQEVAEFVKQPRTVGEISSVRATITHTRLQSLKGYLETANEQ